MKGFVGRDTPAELSDVGERDESITQGIVGFQGCVGLWLVYNNRRGRGMKGRREEEMEDGMMMMMMMT